MTKPNHSIEDHLVEKIRSSAFGDLIPEEDAYEIIKRAIDKVFFTSVVTTEPGWNGKTTTKSSKVVQAVEDHLSGFIITLAFKYLEQKEKEEEDTLQAIIERKLKDVTLNALADRVIHRILEAPLEKFNGELVLFEQRLAEKYHNKQFPFI